jgi:DNA-binding response OmpR family regulator
MTSPLTPRRVLHIDDDQQFTRLVQHRLEHHGFEVECLHDERSWRERLVVGNHRLVLLDLELPNLSGLQLLRDIKRHDGGVQVIMLTAHVRMFVALEALRCGAEYCFFKPVEQFEPLVQALNSTFLRLDHWRSTISMLCQTAKPSAIYEPVASP